MVFILEIIVLLALSALWQMRLRGLCKLPVGSNCQWGKLSLALVDKVLISKTLIQLSADGWDSPPSLLVVWPEATQPWSRANGDLQEGSLQGAPPRTVAAPSAMVHVASHCKPTPP